VCLCMCMCSDRTVSCWKSNDSHIDVDSCDDWLWELVITVCLCFTLVLHDICDSVFHSLQTVLLVVLITPYYILCLFYFHTWQTVHYLSVIYCLFAERNWTCVILKQFQQSADCLTVLGCYGRVYTLHSEWSSVAFCCKIWCVFCCQCCKNIQHVTETLKMALCTNLLYV